MFAYVPLTLTLPFLTAAALFVWFFVSQWGDLTPSGACRLVQEKAAASAASGVPL